MTRWRCTVCDFISDGEAPPDICPVCAAPASAFEKIDEKISTFSYRKFLISLHLHPIFSHFTNSLFPVSILFIGIFFYTGNISFERTSFYIYVVGVLITPLTFGAGMLDWYLRYNRVSAKIFTEKIILSLILIPLSFPPLIIRFINPDALIALSLTTCVYIGAIIIQTGIIFRLGYLGGKLIFS